MKGRAQGRRKHRGLRAAAIAAAVLSAVIALVLAAGRIAMLSGESSLRKGGGDMLPALAGEETDVPQKVWKEGWVRHKGKIYEYNEDIFTFLLLGIDKMDQVSPNPDKVSGGQSDAIFLAVMNPQTKRLSLIGVNRDTMVDIRMVGMAEDGGELTATAQLAVQHGFGDGMEGSCELTKEAVSKLFYGIPIHGYASFNMGGVAALNDALGGVELAAMDGMTGLHEDWTEGTTVSLMGIDAFEYVHYRDPEVFESSRLRLERQKQYLSVFIGKAVEATKGNPMLPLTLYDTLKDYVVTDISVDEMLYLAGELMGYGFGGGDIYTLEGTTKTGEEFEEFYPDREALKELMLELFYREVE